MKRQRIYGYIISNGQVVAVIQSCADFAAWEKRLTQEPNTYQLRRKLKAACSVCGRVRRIAYPGTGRVLDGPMCRECVDRWNAAVPEFQRVVAIDEAERKFAAETKRGVPRHIN